MSATSNPFGTAPSRAGASVFTLDDLGLHDSPAGAATSADAGPAPAAWASDPVGAVGARIAGLRARAVHDPNATLRLVLKASIALWALLVFVLLCVITNLAGGVARPSAACDDANACTADLAVGGLGGGCAHMPVRDGTPCAGDAMAACYVAQVSGAPPYCHAGTCRAGACLGACAHDSDCPTISVRTTPTHGTCVWGQCIYVEKARLSVTTTSCDTPIFYHMCDQMLDADAPLRRCISTSSTCAASELSCIYTFSCGKPVPPKMPAQ